MTSGFPQAFTGTVTWYTEDDQERQVKAPEFGTIQEVKEWCRQYMDDNDLEGLGEVRVVGVATEAPESAPRPSRGKRGGRTDPVRKMKLSRPMSHTLVNAYLDAVASGNLDDVVVKPHDGMISKGLSRRHLIDKTEAGYWRMTAEGRRIASYLIEVSEQEGGSGG